ncbi:MAG: ATP-binding protein [Firmicutes bacterium HGW-Firmicutes-12]|jgi:fluoroquinolone transport system ATP-binding protein|nr:MAG: ATP-binding protein [Firmicutes bacterium HGW-Firmicutes-12]
MIKVNGLSFSYEKSTTKANDNISFQIEKGEIFGFLGPNGAGKSTTQKILIGLLKNYEGTAQVLGRDLKSWGKEYYQKIGVSFELPTNFQKLTGRENLEFFSTLYAGETEDAIRLLELVGLSGDIDTKAGNYSKGMQMRLNFARALINKPELIFLDEPTSGLDPASSRNIRDLILDQKEKGHTVFLTTHNMFIADELCDRVAFLVDGKIELIESPSKLKIDQGEKAVAVRYLGKKTVQQEEFPLEGLGENEKFLKLIRNETIQTIHTKEPTLEDIFISLTGRSLL